MNVAAIVAGRLLAALFLTFCVDALLFRTGWYTRILDPDSSTAAYELMLAQERSEQDGKQRRVLVIGDSRNGFMARPADEVGDQYQMRFANMTAGGTSPRCWYYLLRDLDPSASAYAAVMIPVDYYEDEETYDDLRDRTADLSFVIMRLRLSDVPEFSASFASPMTRWQALRNSLWKGYTLSRDLVALIDSPATRFATIAARRQWYEWVYHFTGDTKSLRGLDIDWDRRQIHFPAALPEKERQPFRDIVASGPLITRGWIVDYRRHWLGRIVHHYQGSQTRVIFFRLPRGPIPRPATWLHVKSSVVRELARQSNVAIADETLFAPLEKPDYFTDPSHMNGEGMVRFSQTLANLAQQLSPRS